MIYYGDEIGMTGAQDPDNRRMFPDLKKLSPEEKKVQEHVSKLNVIRAAHPAIRYGSRRCLQSDRDTYAVVRAYLEDRVLILYNRSEQPKEINLDVDPEFSDGPLIDPLGSLSKQEVQKGKLTLLLPALSNSILISQ
jgi:glycosidase